ncbi:hypothetical protein [Crossiella sp. CA198]|uniref:hypothetical protein n=1 Tax=Crossiella sp. CA198 TaxID=3455607 RepID=UPI003F8D3A5E
MRKSNRVLLTALTAFSLLAAGTQVSATAEPSGASDVGTPISSHTDASGRVTVTVFERRSHQQQLHRDHMVTMPDPEMAVVGGGAVAWKQGYGALLTASYPSEDKRGWRATSKDHVEAQSHDLSVYVIGMKIAGISGHDLRERYIHVNKNPGSMASHAEAEVGPPPTGGPFEMLGGGFNVKWGGAGNLATASYPSSALSWKAKSKDHIESDPAAIDAYGIYIKKHLPVGTVTAVREPGHAGHSAHPEAAASVGADYALTGGGAEVHWQGAGNMLWQLRPAAGLTRTFQAGAKDHRHNSPATMSVWALGIRLF